MATVSVLSPTARRRAVRVDVVDVARDAGRASRSALLHHADHPAAILGGRGDVVRVARHPVAGELAVDRRAAVLRVLELLEDEDARAFAHHEAVAVQVPRTRGALRLVVARRERAHGREAADARAA